ncbi:MAG: tetratricopeptide repeat protein [Candidatus Firestonebacteria bacterium]|nr:tetratricopeptide repeat protein [Candidatus Firestonebacteria bacterium]
MNFLDKNLKNILHSRNHNIIIDDMELIYIPILKKEIFLLEYEVKSLKEFEQDKVYGIYARGKQLIDQDNYRDAIEVFSSISNTVNKPLATGFYNLGCAYYYNRQYNEAVAALKQAISISSDFKEAYQTLAHTYLKLKQEDKALIEFKKILKEWPVFKNILFDLGTTCILLKDYKSAAKYLSGEIKYNPKHIQAYNNLGFAYSKMSIYRDATSYFQKAIDLSSHYGRPYINIALCCLKSGNSDTALMNLKNLLMFHPHNKLAHFLIGYIYKTKGNFYEAQDHYITAINLSFNMPDAHLHLGICYMDKGFSSKNDKLIEDAVEELNIYISLRTFDGCGYLFKGIIYQKRGKTAESVRLYEKALQCFNKAQINDINHLYSLILLLELYIQIGDIEKLKSVLVNEKNIFPDHPYLKELYKNYKIK